MDGKPIESTIQSLHVSLKQQRTRLERETEEINILLARKSNGESIDEKILLEKKKLTQRLVDICENILYALYKSGQTKNQKMLTERKEFGSGIIRMAG